MDKVKVTTPAGMNEAQILEDISMTPQERLTLAFKISDFARELHPNLNVMDGESSSIKWIELRKVDS